MAPRIRRRSRAVRFCLMAAGLVSAATVFAASDDRSAGGMSQNERGVLEELNLARTRPSEYASYVEEHKRNFKGYFVVVVDGRKAKVSEGIQAVDEAIEFLKSAVPVPALSDSGALTLSARDHVKDLGPRGMTGHVGTDGSQPVDRIRRYAAPRTVSGEIISFGPVSPRSIVIQLIVDDGVPGRDHRKSIFDADFRYAGIAIGPHQNRDYMCVVDMTD